MFVLPALILPLVFALAVARLYQIPRRLWSNELRLPGVRRPVLSAVTIAAYLALFAYTVGLGAALCHALLVAENRMAEYLYLLSYVIAYPVVYFLSAWTFYYGLRPASTPGT
jgi:hypothetical protein